MKKYETITGILGYICLLSLGAGPGVVLLYRQGDALSLFIVFLTIFSSPFFISGIRNQTNVDIVDMFIKDFIIGLAAVLICGLTLLSGSYEAMAGVASLSVTVILIAKSV